MSLAILQRLPPALATGEVLDFWFLAARGVIEVNLFDKTLGRSCRPLFIRLGGKQSWRPLERGRLHGVSSLVVTSG